MSTAHYFENSKRQIKTSKRGRKKKCSQRRMIEFSVLQNVCLHWFWASSICILFFFLPVCMSPFLPSHFLAEGNQSAGAGAPSPPSQHTLSVTRFSSSVICSFHSTARAAEDETGSPLTADHRKPLCSGVKTRRDALSGPESV